MMDLDGDYICQSVKHINQKIVSSSTAKTKGVKNPIKLLVSKQKRRFKLDGFNLDLTCEFIWRRGEYK